MNRWTPGDTLEDIEQDAIEQAFQFYQGNKTQTARSLGIAVNTLENKLKKYREVRDEQSKRDAELLGREREFAARERAITEAEPVGSSDMPSGVPLESFEKAPSQHGLSVREQAQVQEVLPKRPASVSTGKGR